MDTMYLQISLFCNAHKKYRKSKNKTMTTNSNHNLCLHYVKDMRISFLNISKAIIHSPDQIRFSILYI